MLGGSSRFLYMRLMVELSTPLGSVFSGHADGVDMETTDGAIAINPQDESYLNLTQMTQITLRVGTEFLSFALKNAAASLRDGQLTVLAEEAQPNSTAQKSGAPGNGNSSS
jgi:F0F1-type ATP synthase epsilon subunit